MHKIQAISIAIQTPSAAGGQQKFSGAAAHALGMRSSAMSAIAPMLKYKRTHLEWRKTDVIDPYRASRVYETYNS
jgi:hypothetical protein